MAKIKHYNPDEDWIEWRIPIGPWGHIVYGHKVGAWRDLARILTEDLPWPILLPPIIALILVGSWQLLAKITPLPSLPTR